MANFELAPFNLNLPQRTGMCHGKFEFGVVSLKFCGQFLFSVGNLNFAGQFEFEKRI